MPKTLAVFCVLILLGLGMMVTGGYAQRNRNPFPAASDSADHSPSFRLPPNGPSRSRELLRESFEKTQKETAELYNLAAELKQEMENATEDVLSITVMKKAEAIEKLAERIKNRMKNL